MYYIFLSKPSDVYKSQYKELIEEWELSGEELIPWVFKANYLDFPKLTEFLLSLEEGVNLSSGFVKCSTYWLIRNDGKLLGASNIRHELKPELLETNGHISYGIRPSERSKGYGTTILRLSLLEAKKFGITKVRITCDDDNIASEKIIIKNNGIFLAKAVNEKGTIIKKFLINNSN